MSGDFRIYGCFFPKECYNENNGQLAVRITGCFLLLIFVMKTIPSGILKAMFSPVTPWGRGIM